MLVLLIIFFSYITIGSLIYQNQNKIFYIFNYAIATTPTNSMDGNNGDSFGSGSIVLLTNTKYENLKIDDIIVYQDDFYGKLIIHRIVDEDELGFITKGDNEFDNDFGYVNKQTYQGKYLTHFNFFKIGIWIEYFKFTIFLVMILLFSGLLYKQVVSIKDHNKE